MEIHQLRYLLAVADAGSFTAAADALHVAQSGVSAQVAKLERELGVGLLERLPRGVVPTDAGTAVLAATRTALDALDAVAATAGRHGGLLAGRVRLGTVRGGAMSVVTGPLASLARDHPGVEVVVTEDGSEALADDVREGRLDLALVGWSGDPPAGLESTSLGEDALVAALGPRHPLAAGRGRLTPARLASASVLALPRGTGARAALDRACAAAGVGLRIAVEAGDPATLAALARQGLGAAVLSERTAAAYADGLVVRPVATTATSHLGLVHRAAPTPAAADLRARMLAVADR
jgi:DNA-binding transcriptional LysR family regulator